MTSIALLGIYNINIKYIYCKIILTKNNKIK